MSQEEISRLRGEAWVLDDIKDAVRASSHGL